VKLVLFESATGPAWGVLGSGGVVNIADVVIADSPQEGLEHLIDDWDALRPRLEKSLDTADALPLESVRLLPPVPRPGKILWTTAVYAREARNSSS